MEPPKIHIDPQRIMAEDFEKVLISKYDIFYRRIVEYVLNILEKKKSEVCGGKNEFRNSSNSS